MYGGAVSSNNQHYYQGWDPKLYCRQRPQGKHHKNILILKFVFQNVTIIWMRWFITIRITLHIYLQQFAFGSFVSVILVALGHRRPRPCPSWPGSTEIIGRGNISQYFKLEYSSVLHIMPIHSTLTIKTSSMGLIKLLNLCILNSALNSPFLEWKRNRYRIPNQVSTIVCLFVYLSLEIFYHLV